MSARSRFRALGTLLAVSWTLVTGSASARMIVARPPATSIATVQTELAALEPEVQRCAADTTPRDRRD